MAFFGGGGVRDKPLHPSLKTYIDCFLSPPWPKQFPRGGGIHDQEPELVRDFRVIMKFEREWKDAQDQIQKAQTGSGGGGSMGEQLEQALAEAGYDSTF